MSTAAAVAPEGELSSTDSRASDAAPALPGSGSTAVGSDVPSEFDPGAVEKLAATARTAGENMLPVLASALSSLADGDRSAAPAAAAAGKGATRQPDGNSGASGIPASRSTSSRAAESPADLAADGASAGLSPAAQRAVRALRMLAAAYGDGNPTDPEVIELRKMLGLTPGSGGAASGSRARQMFQSTAATAFNNLDNQLAQYVSGLAGNHKVDHKKLTRLIREVNVALAELGPHAYTREGQTKVHQILGAALQKAHAIVSAGQSSAKDMAAHVQRLTAQYLWNINGQQSPSGTAVPGYGTTTTVGQGGSVGQWIQQALEILRQAGTDMSKVDPAAIAIMAQHESSNNPRAINLWDDNAKRGTPSKGLLQTIDPTFRQYALPGYNDIWNPVHNIIAGVRYALDRYGSLSNVPGVKAVRAGGAHVGY
ncbi:DUF4226 domain-containing protein [Nocardia cyriacigeorgica]|uniref:DUF4226 domain-containing protein n=1 Tax=Nocardia cyriacigeorgica TaxID=135487 RepID=UPI0018937BCE|nr:DUF4226 domain-containing protein [Nocardia cyriacigeorgica]MBF6398082.1 DUF4226 domain-containing protein [Nocardia cyriacigeorgica]MBF6404404.1 DUF4226 domain-containing protein [Nocardia cyriacigeorgica]